MSRTKEEEKEIERNAKGKLIWILSILFIIIACFGFNGGSAAVMFGMTGVVGFIVGLFMTMGHRSKSEFEQRDRQINRQAELMVQMAKAGMSAKDMANNMSKMGPQKKPSDSGTKEIIKGAVIGGIVAGEAGAVVGATVAKNKLDNQKKE